MKATIQMHHAETAEALRQILNQVDVECIVARGGLGQFAKADGEPVPDLLFVEVGTDGNDLDMVEQVTRLHPHLAVVLVVADPNKDFLLHAIHAGVKEVLSPPLQTEMVRELVVRLRRRLLPSRSGQGKVLAFQPCKGGSGATFLASNIAYALARQGKRVALIDLNMQFGDAALHVSDMNATANVADVAQQIQRLDGEFLVSSMIRVLPNFGVLASPDSPEKAVGIRPDDVKRMLEVARERYDYVIVDIDRTLEPVSIQALDSAEVIYLVLQLTLPFIRDAKRLLAVFDSLGYPRSKVRIIVNRYQPGGEITLSDVESTLRVEVAKTIPNSFAAVAASVNQGAPIVDFQPGDKVSKALVELARQWGQVTPARTGWLSRMFGKQA